MPGVYVCRSASSKRLCTRFICSARCLAYTLCWNVGYAYILHSVFVYPCLRYFVCPILNTHRWCGSSCYSFISLRKKPTTKTYTNIRIFVNVCESSFLYHTKWFSIHMMGRMLTPFLLQLLLLLLFVRTYIYLPCRFSWILAIDILFGRHTSNLDVLSPFVSCLRFPFC